VQACSGLSEALIASVSKRRDERAGSDRRERAEGEEVFECLGENEMRAEVPDEDTEYVVGDIESGHQSEKLKGSNGCRPNPMFLVEDDLLEALEAVRAARSQRATKKVRLKEEGGRCETSENAVIDQNMKFILQMELGRVLQTCHCPLVTE
jgi:hypothetical protein